MGDVKFSILTPWLPPRESIHATINYIDAQTYSNWEHLIAIDRPGYELTSADSRRRIYDCGAGHNTWGNTCRHNLWAEATGDWIIYLDDDDILYPNALERIAQAIDSDAEKEWGYFAIKLGPNIFFHVPCGGGLITGGQIFHRKIAHNGEELRWYDNTNYGADWDHIYQHFVKPERVPIIISDVLGELPKHGVGLV